MKHAKQPKTEVPDVWESEGGSLGAVEGKVCMRCGMERTGWHTRAGAKKSGEVYCCAGCAENTGCTCVKEPTESAIDAQIARRSASTR